MAFISYKVGGTQGGVTDPTTRARPGDMSTGNDGSQFVHIKAAEAIAQYDFVTYDESYNAYKLTKANVDAGHRIGCSQQALASGDYADVQTSGVFTGNVLASCAADVALYTTATAGSLDDTTTSQTKITGVVLTTARGGTNGSAPANAQVPMFGGP